MLLDLTLGWYYNGLSKQGYRDSKTLELLTVYQQKIVVLLIFL